MKELTLQATLEKLPEVMAFIDEWLETLDCTIRAQTQIDVAVDELFSNIARYAYTPGVGDATVRLEYDDSTHAASITFIDGGISYNPLEKEDPDVTLSPEEREIGGLGIFLVKKTMDRMDYRREDDHNILTIHKKIN